MSEPFQIAEADFTEEHYRELLGLAKEHYRFIGFDELDTPGPTILWRHDIDMSPHRALAIAKLEAEAGVRATYFVLLHSEHYNALELEVTERLVAIAHLGHHIGLHFDPNYYTSLHGDEVDLEPFIRQESTIVETLTGARVMSFSWHNPTVGAWIERRDGDEIAGLRNVYGTTVRRKFDYVSDSNGVWRFRRLYDVLVRAEEQHLQVLTHPALWVPDAMPVRARVSRAIEGRAARQHGRYDEFLAAEGRPNVR